MKAYSQYNLIEEELFRLESEKEAKSIFSKLSDLILSKLFEWCEFNIKVPNYIYLRAKILCEDVELLSGYEFRVHELIYLLYRMFLHKMIKQDDPFYIYQVINVRSLDKPKVKRVGQFMDIEDYNDKVKSVNVRIKRKYVLRGEVILRDLENIVPNHNLTIEKILETIFIDFIKEYQSGSFKNAMNVLIQALEEIDD
jgi:hypothetical protein